MKFLPVSETMQQSECGQYQLSRTPKPTGSKHTYRAWHRPTNELLREVTVYDEPGDRAAAIAECKEACAEHRDVYGDPA